MFFAITFDGDFDGSTSKNDAGQINVASTYLESKVISEKIVKTAILLLYSSFHSVG